MAEQEAGLDVMIHRLLHVAIKRRWWVVVPMVVGALLGCVVSTKVPNSYLSEATILVAHQQVPERYVTPNNTSTLREQLLLVTDAILSRTQLLQIINEFDLYPNQRKRMAPEDLVELMRADIVIAPMERTPDQKDLNSFKISFTAYDPHVAQDVTSKLTSLFILGDLKTRGDVARETNAFLDEQVQAAAQDLSRQESRVRDFKMQYLGQLPEEQASNLGILTGLHAQLQNTESLLSHAREQQVFLESLISQYRTLSAAGVSVPGAPTANATDELKVELMRLKDQRSDLLARYTEQYPDVVKLNQQIKELEAQEAATLKAAAAAKQEAAKEEASKAKTASTVTPETDVTLAQYRSQLDANHTEIQNALADQKRLEAQIADYNSRLNMTPVREQQLSDLLRNYDLSKKNYEDLLSKKTDSKLATSLQERQEGQRFTLIDPASLPMKPASPMHLKIALGGLAVGLSLGVGMVFLLETIDHSLLDEKDLTRYFNFPLLIGLPALPTTAEKRKRSRLQILEWVGVTTLCLLVCVSEFYIYRRG